MIRLKNISNSSKYVKDCMELRRPGENVHFCNYVCELAKVQRLLNVEKIHLYTFWDTKSLELVTRLSELKKCEHKLNNICI